MSEPNSFEMGSPRNPGLHIDMTDSPNEGPCRNTTPPKF